MIELYLPLKEKNRQFKFMSGTLYQDISHYRKGDES
jgi:hypothetical protein